MEDYHNKVWLLGWNQAMTFAEIFGLNQQGFIHRQEAILEDLIDRRTTSLSAGTDASVQYENIAGSTTKVLAYKNTDGTEMWFRLPDFVE